MPFALRAGVSQSRDFIDNEAGFSVRVMGEWYRDEANTGMRETAEHLAEVKALYGLYKRFHEPDWVLQGNKPPRSARSKFCGIPAA